MIARTITGALLAGLLSMACLVPITARADSRFDLDEIYPVAPQGTILLSTDDADVTIVGTERDDVHVEIHYRLEVTGIELGGEEFRVDVDASGGDLRIEEVPRRRVMSMGVRQRRYTVRIEAPESVSLDIRGDDDDYDIRGYRGAVALDADDGKIRLNGRAGTAFDLAFGDGELDMTGGAGSLRLRFDDGDAEIRDAAFDTMSVQQNDGSLRMVGDLAEDGTYDFKSDDGDMDLAVGEGGGDFSFACGDGTLTLDGGRGSFELDYDDGRATLRRAGFERLDVRGDDGLFVFEGEVPAGADYGVDLDDGRVELRVRGGGGRVEAHFDDGRVKADSSFRAISEAEHQASYAWGKGDASVQISVNDGSVRLSAR